MGYHVLLLNECATEIINGGIRPFGDNQVSVFDFQNEILNLQIFKEKRFLDIISKLPEDTKCIILSDRGIMDSKAYLGSELFTKLLDQNNLKEDDLGQQYDMVIHLVTVAANNQNKYNNSTNSARFEEDIDEVLDLDRRTNEVWQKHKNLKRVEATGTIEEKIEKVINIIHDYLEI